MIAKEIRWTVLAAMGILFALGRLVTELLELWPWEEARPDVMFCLADATAAFTAPGAALFAYALCGLLGDLFIGPRLGSGMASFIVAGFLLIVWRNAAAPKGWLGNILLAGMMAALAAYLKTILDAGPLAAGWPPAGGLTALANGLAAIALYPVLLLALRLPPLRPWRERETVIFDY